MIGCCDVTFLYPNFLSQFFFRIEKFSIGSFNFVPVSIHALAASVGHGLGCDETAGGLQDRLVHALVALHPRSSHALRLEEGEPLIPSSCMAMGGLGL